MRALTKASMSLGERFRAAREERGLTLSEVAEQLRIRSVYLAAIEEENWKTIGAPVYTRGFLRTYARFLNLDPEEAVAAFNSATGTTPASVSEPPLTQYEIRQRQRSLLPFIWIAAAVAIALIGFVIYLYVAPPRPASNVAAPASPSTLPSPAPQPSPKATPIVKQLEVRLAEGTWLRVTVDGSVKIEGLFPAGTSKTFRGNSVLIRAGNAKGVVVTVNGKTIGAMGGEGDVVEKNFKL